jgi:CubicO group peptidase (beta-lactamase class C family)
MADTAEMIVAEPFEELVERLERESEEGFFHTAAQVVVTRAGEPVLDVAMGRTHLHEPFRPDTLSALYCTAKPLVAVGILKLVADGELSLDDQLGHVVDGLDTPWIAERTVEQVLGHTAGLHILNTVVARILPESMRTLLLEMMPPPEGWRFGLDRSYAEFGGWFLLGKVIESLTGEEFGDWVTDKVLEPYGVSPRDLVVHFDADSFAAERDRISVTYDLTMAQPIPLLAEIGAESACEWNPAFGAYGTMGAVAAFYRGLLDDLAGAELVLPADLLADATTPRLPLTYDETLGREAGFGLGFMTPLSSHFFGSAPSEPSFGHAGQGGTSFAMADPEEDLVIAVLFNAGLDADTALSFRRVNLVDAIYRGLDELG